MSLQRPGNSLNMVAPEIADMVVNSAYSYIARLGSAVSHDLVVDGTPNGIQNNNIFSIEGGVEILRLFGHFSDVTDVSAVTAANFDVYTDAPTTIQLTTIAGTDLSGSSENALIGRTDTAAVALDYLNSDQVRIIDGAVGLDLFAPFIVSAEYSRATYLRFNYTSDGGGAEFTIHFEAVWRPLIRTVGFIDEA